MIKKKEAYRVKSFYVIDKKKLIIQIVITRNQRRVAGAEAALQYTRRKENRFPVKDNSFVLRGRAQTHKINK